MVTFDTIKITTNSMIDAFNTVGVVGKTLAYFHFSGYGFESLSQPEVRMFWLIVSKPIVFSAEC